MAQGNVPGSTKKCPASPGLLSIVPMPGHGNDIYHIIGKDSIMWAMLIEPCQSLIIYEFMNLYDDIPISSDII